MIPEYKMTKEEAKKFFKNLRTAVAIDLVNDLKRRVPVDSGRLRNSIKYRVIGSEVIIYMVKYAPYVEFGTPPHIITPVNAKALHWVGSGLGPRGGVIKSDVFAKVVHHPGTRPQPFIRPAIRDDMPQIVNQSLKRLLA